MSQMLKAEREKESSQYEEELQRVQDSHSKEVQERGVCARVHVCVCTCVCGCIVSSYMYSVVHEHVGTMDTISRMCKAN